MLKSKKELVLEETYRDYLQLLKEGKSKAEALEALSYLHPITLARLVKFLEDQERAAQTA